MALLNRYEFSLHKNGPIRLSGFWHNNSLIPIIKNNFTDYYEFEIHQPLASNILTYEI